MPNRKAKDRKQKRQKLNEKWKREGRTAAQHKKWLKKMLTHSTLMLIILKPGKKDIYIPMH